MKIKNHHYFYLFVSFLFLGIVSVELFSEGMFMDGLIYADIARNMSEGLGTFWKPHFTQTFLPEFYEHPPLALGLQSLFFSVLGDTIYTERLYALTTYIIIGYTTVLIWESLTSEKKHGWIPVFLWLTTAGVTWALTNNLLENTMSIFVNLSVLFYLWSTKKNLIFWLFLSGTALSLGVLTKGFVCLYIWGVPFFFWAFRRNTSFTKTIISTISLILFTVLPIALLFLMSDSARNNMLSYLDIQVRRSIQNVQTVDTRFAIIGEFLESASIPLVIVAVFVIIAKALKLEKSLFTKNLRGFLMFTTITLSGVLPIMISLKQRDFYILTVYPLFSIGLAYYIYPIIKPVLANINYESRGFKVFKVLTIGMTLTSTILCFNTKNKLGRDKEMIQDSKAVINIVGENEVIGICPSIHSNWSLHGYFSRYGNVSLNKNQNILHPYYISTKDCHNEIITNNYKIVPLETNIFKLHELKNN